MDALTEGFLPMVDGGRAAAARNANRPAEMGLPYAADPAITRHLAAFLREAARSDESAGGEQPGGQLPNGHLATDLVRPDAVLFNGGFFTPAAGARAPGPGLSRRGSIRPAPGGPRSSRTSPPLRPWRSAPPTTRSHAAPGARGFAPAAPAAYYIGIARGATDAAVPGARLDDGQISALCVLPRGTEEGTSFRLAGHELTVVTNRPVSFPLFSSAARQDAAGDLSKWTKRTCTVTRRSRPSCGTVASRATWSWRSASRRPTQRPGRSRSRASPRAASTGGACGSSFAASARRSPPREGRTIAPSRRCRPSVSRRPRRRSRHRVRRRRRSKERRGARPTRCPRCWRRPSGSDAPPGRRPSSAPWPTRCCEHAEGRRRGARFEARWLNLLGFCLRPGFGAPLDDWRVGRLRGVYVEGLVFRDDPQCQAEWSVAVAARGGRPEGRAAAASCTSATRRCSASAVRRASEALNPQVQREAWRLLGSLEHLPAPSV